MMKYEDSVAKVEFDDESEIFQRFYEGPQKYEWLGERDLKKSGVGLSKCFSATWWR